MRLRMMIFLLLWTAVQSFAFVAETGTLRGFVLGHEPACAYDNWLSHVSERIVRPGYDDYGPSWFDPATNGFGGFTYIPSNSAGDQTLQDWRDVFTAGINAQWSTVDSLLARHDSTWRYQLVQLTDTELNKVFYLLRERLDSSYVDINVPGDPTDDVTGGFRNGWGLFVFNPTARYQKVAIEVPHPEDDFMAPPIALEMFVRCDARAMMIAGAGREVMWDSTQAYFNNDRSLSDPARNCRTPFSVYHQTLYDLLNAGVTSPMTTIQMHSYDHYTWPALNDVHISAFLDSLPNPPIQDPVAHKDIVNFLPENPVNGLPGHPEITRRVDQYVDIMGATPYAYYGTSDTLPLPNPNASGGASSNCEGLYSHSNHDVVLDPENFIHIELDEYPDGLWMPEDWHAWLPGGAPATLTTFAPAIAYFSPLITAMDSALKWMYVYPDTAPPVAVHLDQVVPLSADSMYLHWTPKATDRFFDTYTIYYDTLTVSDSSANHTRHDAGYAALKYYNTTSAILSGLIPPINRYHFAVASRDLSGNRAARSPAQGQTPGPFVLTRSLTINDTIGGDGNRAADYGESFRFSLGEQNLGDSPAAGVTVKATSLNPFLTITDSLEAYGAIASQQLVTVANGFSGALSVNVPDSQQVALNVLITDSAAHSWPGSLTILAHAPTLQVSEVTVVDTGAGNSDGILNAGENVRVVVLLKNAGSKRADSVSAVLTTDYPNVTITQATGSLNAIPSGQSVALSSFLVSASAAAPAMDRAAFYLTLTTRNGRTSTALFELPIGGFADNAEHNTFGTWTHQANQTGWVDNWRISTTRYHSATRSFKFGGSGAGTYSNHADGVLVSPTLTLSGHQELRFWQWMSSQQSPTYADSCYDGGIVEISVDGGAWQQLTPRGGYNKWIRGVNANGTHTSGPFTPRTPCFGGTIGWTEVVCDLGAFTGSAQVRFHFGSDSTTVLEGWYIDNIRVVKANDAAAPHNFQALLTDSLVTMSWNSPGTVMLAGDLRGYNVYRNGNLIASSLTTLSFSDLLLGQPFSDYAYAVSAQYSDSESALSDPVTIHWLAPLVPVSDLIAVTDSQSVYLTWTPTNAEYYWVLSSLNPTDFSAAVWTRVDAPPYTITTDPTQYIKRFYVVVSARH